MAALLLVLRDLVVPAVASAVVIVFASLISRGTLHRTDRVGAAAIAIAFAVGYQSVIGGGFDPEALVSVLPLAAVVSALIAPRLAARVAPGAGVPASTRAGLVLAGIAGAVALSVAEQVHFAGLTLATVGGALGMVAATHLADREPTSLRGPDQRAGAWLLVAGLLAAVWGFAVAAGMSAVAVALLVAAVVAAPLAARRGGRLGDILAVGLPAGLGVAATVVAGA